MKFKQWIHFFRADADDAEVSSILDGKVIVKSVKKDEQSYVRLGWLALGVTLLAFFLWALLAPLGEGVPVHGVIKVAGNSKTIQHLRGGIVEEILVSDGDKVKENDPLLRLNDVQLKSQKQSIESQLLIGLANEARLLAERDDANEIVFPSFLIAHKKDPKIKEVLRVQGQLFRSRRASMHRDMEIGTQTIAGLKEQIGGLNAQEISKSELLGSYNAEMKSNRPLYDQGYIPRNRLFELERSISQVTGERSDDLASIGRAKRQIAEEELRILQSRSAYQKDVETQLADAQGKVAEYQERYIASEDDLNRVIVRAPIDGVVVDSLVHTIGGVIQPGQKLMDIVPEMGGLEVEVQIPTHLIDHVHVGLGADVHFTALDATHVPPIPGKLSYVSADRVADTKSDIAYFVGRVKVTPEGMALLDKELIRPGMPADAIIKTNERTLVGYLMKPLMNRMRFAFTER
jgi:protease secretion system membrane fusion protein